MVSVSMPHEIIFLSAPSSGVQLASLQRGEDGFGLGARGERKKSPERG